MNRLRPAAIIAAVLLACGLIAGCNKANANFDPASATMADPKADLHQAIQKLATTTSTLTLQLSGGAVAANATGQLDPTSGTAAITITALGHPLEFRVLSDAIYVNLGDVASMAGLPPGWVRLDKARLIGSLGNSLKPDQALGAAASIDAAISVTTSGPGHYEGTLDASKLSGPVGLAKGATDHVIPFTATANAQGYLTTLTITAKQATVTLTFSDIGKPVNIKAPPAKEVTDAPDTIYDALSALGK